MTTWNKNRYLNGYLINSKLFSTRKQRMIAFYTAQLSNLRENQVLLQKSYNKTSTYRLVLLIAGLIIQIQAFRFNLLLGGLSLVAFVFGFYYLVKYHEKTEENLLQNENQQDLLKYELDALSNIGNKKYDNGEKIKDPHHLFSADLDLFGENSLFQLVNRAKTKLGKEMLESAMLNIETDENIIKNKQEAVKELSSKTEWRLAFLASLINISQVQAETANEIAHIPNPPKLQLRQFIKIYGFMLPFLWILFFIVFYFLKFEGIGYGLGVFILFNFFINGINSKITEPYLEQIAVTGRALQSFSRAAELIANEHFESQVLQLALQEFPKADLQSKNPIEEFALIIKKLDMRKNLMASLFLISAKPFVPIETIKLENWLVKNPKFFQEIFSTIGIFEYYASLATLSFNHKDWAFPETHLDSSKSIEAKLVGHPLIKGHQTVGNDFVLGEKNRVNLITGSNMSGKSTFLRTLGINLILANLGGPVFAENFKYRLGMIPVCYMRITDSINENASTFKAEIERIKLVLEALKTKDKYIFLIDEMLRGTNSEDKLKGSMALFEKLIKEGATALIATHDLRLSEISDKYVDKVKNFYFEYSTENGELFFDYKIKEGVCKSFNASLLLASIGLKID
ncbi:hypothetical protein EGI22_07655 [Lacihabitans sp. LS3-19]|uniref:MutS-related protein n=1 Tax=Lacihabitans sp. LS3-19 TaxID=2487335 RepID=UPI0020CFDA49|nr:hypothetical protein [Lacihabitans sp. LS3-19]MCP9767785.1 hypothetical protein [Lacihabitans sp. LS3-19]